MKNNNFGLAKIKNTLSNSSNNYLKDIEKELVQEEEESLKDFIKGAYRLVLEKEKAADILQKEIAQTKEAIDQASKGNWGALSNIRIPARFFNESTLRKHGKSLLEGSNEVRFMDLYVPSEEEE